jgi:hypothetical protein
MNKLGVPGTKLFMYLVLIFVIIVIVLVLVGNKSKITSEITVDCGAKFGICRELDVSKNYVAGFVGKGGCDFAAAEAPADPDCYYCASSPTHRDTGCESPDDDSNDPVMLCCGMLGSDANSNAGN